MTPETRSEPDWADDYLRRKSDDADEADVDPIVPPESASFMDDLSYLDLSNVGPQDRGELLERAVDVLVEAMTSEDGVAERIHNGRSVAAFDDGESVVVVIDGFGEAINVDRATAALVAFARRLGPREDEAG